MKFLLGFLDIHVLIVLIGGILIGANNPVTIKRARNKAWQEIKEKATRVF